MPPKLRAISVRLMVAACVLCGIAAIVRRVAVDRIMTPPTRKSQWVTMVPTSVQLTSPAPPGSPAAIPRLGPNWEEAMRSPPLDLVTTARLTTGDFLQCAQPGTSMRVAVFWPGGHPTDDQQELANKTVIWKLRELQPENPGRKETFSRLHWPLPYWAKRGPAPWKWSGFTLVITDVKRQPGGWDATVYVGARVSNGKNDSIPLIIHHTEFYTFRDGKLTLQSELADYRFKPDEGLFQFVF